MKKKNNKQVSEGEIVTNEEGGTGGQNQQMESSDPACFL